MEDDKFDQSTAALVVVDSDLDPDPIVAEVKAPRVKVFFTATEKVNQHAVEVRLQQPPEASQERRPEGLRDWIAYVKANGKQGVGGPRFCKALRSSRS